jgi:pyruvate dehydrogenase E2 component (dihydrolipoamide acetyltransferase)
MPRQGNTVESCIIASWKKGVGDTIATGDVLCEIETDKAMMEVESTASGTVLALFFNEGDEVPVLTNIAAIGEPGENAENLRPDGANAKDQRSGEAEAQESVHSGTGRGAQEQRAVPIVAVLAEQPEADSKILISPRARNLAEARHIDVTNLKGSGPNGRIIERDILAAIQQQPLMTPLAKTMVAGGEFEAPPQGSGVRGRILSGDLKPAAVAPAPVTPQADEGEIIPVKGIRKVIATRMLESVQSTAQLTLNASADARGLLAYRRRLKASSETLGLREVTINDLILFTASRVLLQYPQINALYKEEAIHQYNNVHLGVAVDTPRGLMVPVVRNANALSLKQIAQESKRLAEACQNGSIAPDEMSGGTFTVTNLGNLGIESFTPVLNPPEVAILGVGNINLKPVEVEGEVQFIKHIGLSLTINHQVVDGAPAARFLQAVAQGLAEVELLLAL